MRRIVSILLFFCLLASGVIAKNPIQIKLAGKISCEGKGISDVVVSDGISVVKSDAKGRYVISSTSNQSFVYYSLPSGYDSPLSDGVPHFYSRIDSVKLKQKINFEIQKALRSQDKHAFVLWTDPQVYEMEEFKLLDRVKDDVQQTVNTLSLNQPVHAICVGDIVFEKYNFFDNYKRILEKINAPFYQVLGNHDMNYNNRSDELSTKSYANSFGPTYYSFNKGSIHYVVLKDVFYYGYTYRYIGYVDEAQLRWLEGDLASVKPGSTVIVSLHIPTVYGESAKASYSTILCNSMMNSSALFKILAPFKTHILAGHSHTQWNTVIASNLYEHTHAAACAAWWQGELCVDGTPKGYTVYLADGDSLSWYFKGVGLSENEQFSLYPFGSDLLQADCIVANVYNYDPEWKVRWYENDKLMGEMEQYWGEDPIAAKLYPEGKNKKHTWLSVGETHHLFRAKIVNKLANIKVQVTDRFRKVYTKELFPSK